MHQTAGDGTSRGNEGSEDRLGVRPVIALSQRSRFTAGLAALLAAFTIAGAGSAHAAGAAGLTRIISPTANQVVGSGGVRVVLKSRASLANLDVFINGLDVKRYFRQVGGVYRADLRFGHGLPLGTDELIVVTGDASDFDSVTFVAARPDAHLLKVSRLRLDGPQAPVLVNAKVAEGGRLQAWVNGHRDDAAFEAQDGVYVGRLGDNDWLRSGRNRLVLLAYRTSSGQSSAGYAVWTTSFWQRPRRFMAGAGRDLVVNAGDFVRLDGSATDLGQAVQPRVRYRWKLVHRPPGLAPTLTGATGRAPEFEAKAPGTYLITETATAANGSASVDTLTVSARVDLPPMGGRLDTIADDRGTITLDGDAVPNTTPSCDPGPVRIGCWNSASYAVFNRQTLQVAVSGNIRVDTAGAAALLALASKYNAAPGYLMVLNMSGPLPTTGQADLRKLFDLLGVRNISDDDYAHMAQSFAPFSIVGVPGSPAGSAFISNNVVSCLGSCIAPRQWGSMSGYLRLNPRSATGGYFEFLFNDQLEFNTDVNPDGAQITMKVGGATYSHAVPGDGSSGFFLVRVNSRTMAPDKTFFYVTNKPGGSEDPAEVKRLADDLAAASANHGVLLALLQSFGTPKGTSPEWLALARTIQSLGGNAQVVAQLNQKTHDEPDEGRYALVARGSMDTSAAESSQAVTGHDEDGKLHGLLGRGRDYLFEPLLADPSGTINFELVRIVNNRPSTPGGGFPAMTPGQAAAASFLGRDIHIIGVCAATGPCDVRKAYYEDLTAPWDTILTRLQRTDTTTNCHAASDQAGSGFNHTDCDDAIREFEQEIDLRNNVAAYFAALQSVFARPQVAALVDVPAIAEQIRQAVQPPSGNNATAHVLTIISYVLKIGSLAGTVCQPCGSAASGLGAVFGLAAYTTQQNGTPDLVGPQVTAAATKLGSALFDRYQAASDYITTEARIVLSDWSKMTLVAQAIPSAGWKLPDMTTVAEQIRLAAKQAIYQALIPVAYPVLYDLGTGITDANKWICRSIPTFLYDKRLFQNTGPNAQVSWKMTDSPYIGQTHLFAVGGRHAVGSLHEAYVPSPPASLTDSVFADPSKPGGIGLYKLLLYSPQNFQVFSKVLQQTSPSGNPFGYWSCQDMPDPPGNAG